MGNVRSRAGYRQPHPGVVAWVDSLDEERLYLSAITVGEIKKGMEKVAGSPRAAALSAWLEEDLLLRFRDHILPLDTEGMLAWGQLVAGLERIGKPMPAIDSLIAAQALHAGLHLVTRNVDDFAHWCHCLQSVGCQRSAGGRLSFPGYSALAG